MTLGEILRKAEGLVSDTLTEDALLNMPVKVEIPFATGTYTCEVALKNLELKEKRQWNRSSQKEDISYNILLKGSPVV